ncbi:MAG: glutamyl-tRNA reductase [Proteobacteria bacterium]|nr:glutamyl-tRNA reductase [Pseudomonadota bacterium]
MRIRLLGTNHRRAAVELREQLALPWEEQPAVLEEMAALPGIREVVLVSTCNRLEVVYVETQAEPGLIEAVLAKRSGLSPDRLDGILYRHADADAVSHLFRVCASLDSMVLGESQILGQVKEAYRRAADEGTVGALLHRLFHKAFAAAKRVRSETDIGASTLSVARAAVDLADAVFDDLRTHPVLMLGAGEMGELALRGFRDKGCRDLWVANRTMERAAEVAGPLQAAVLPWSRRAEFLETADIVVASTGARRPVITKADVWAVRRARRGRPLLLIDISVPRNLDAAISDLDSVYLFDIDDLGRVVESGRDSRKREAAKAETLIANEAAAFERVLAQVHVAPLLRALGQRMGQDGRQEVERTLANLAPMLETVPPEVRGAIEDALGRMAQAIGKRFLHHPMGAIKALGAQGEVDLIDAAARLLGVEVSLLSVHRTEDDGATPATKDADGTGES